MIRLPRISNFTDFAPLERHPAVGLRYVDRVQALERPDLVILPGTKSTLADLSWLRQSGAGGTILRLVGKGVPVIGICGGFQMLGRTLEDPQGVEGGGSMHGWDSCRWPPPFLVKSPENRSVVKRISLTDFMDGSGVSSGGL